MNKKLNTLLILVVILVLDATNGLLKTCSPTFHERFLSGGDEYDMRWEYCTKMTFQKSGFAEWHSWATYINQDHFKALFNNYLKSNTILSTDPKADPNKHLIQLDLAVYDEAQW